MTEFTLGMQTHFPWRPTWPFAAADFVADAPGHVGYVRIRACDEVGAEAGWAWEACDGWILREGVAEGPVQAALAAERAADALLPAA